MDLMHDASKIIAMHGRMVEMRSTWETHWQEIAEVVITRKAEFTKGKNSPDQMRGEKRQQKAFDATAGLALERFAAAMESMLTPRNARWHKLAVTDKRLKDNHEVNKYLDEVTDILFQNRYAPSANFASQASEVYLDLGAFGTGTMLVEDDLGRGIRYSSVPLEQVFPIFDGWGNLIGMHRDFELEAHQAKAFFGEDALPDAIKSACQSNPFHRFRFIHRVIENNHMDHGRSDWRGMRYYSCYVSVVGSKIIKQGGYRVMPYACSRYTLSTKETYGRSPAMTVLPTIKTLNSMKKTVLRAAEKRVDPPLMLTQDAALAPFNLNSGAMNAGFLDGQGNPLVQPFETQGDIGLGVDLMMGEQKTINEAFLVTLFQILVETPAMTATEAMLRAQEKGALLAPTMGRQQSEFLGPIIQREIDILAHADALPPMPQALIDIGGEIEIQYESPLTQAQKAGDGVAILNTFQAITPLAQIDPTVLDAFDLRESAKILAEANGYPAKGLKTKEQREADDVAKAEQAQLQQLLAAAPVAAGAAKDFAQAQALAGSSPNQIAPNIVGAE